MIYVGTFENDYVVGSNEDDTFIAFVGDDFLFGKEGDDTFIVYPNDGNHHIRGGSGLDSVVMVWREEYEVSAIKNGFMITDDDGFRLIARNVESFVWSF